ncbi:MAG: acyloxyacyl hydrolase [Flavobacteriaceae bacterium]|nr:acyloxyacyl hydrolase [Flavobacteriaceae bacterium]
MRKIATLIFLAFHGLLLAQESSATAANVGTQSSFTASYFYGNILSKPITHVVQGHPEGLFLSWNKKNFGNKEWEQHYNYPDVGISIGYQDYKSDIVGELYSLYGHYNFYFFNRKNKNQMILRVGIGLAYNTNPYDKITNNKNISFGTHINSSTYFKLYYQRERLFKNIGVEAGLTLIHASNANIKSPNTGVNTWGLTAGLNYNLENEDLEIYEREINKKLKEPIKFNLIFRGGINESEIIGSGIYPFYVFSGYADKRLNRKSALQFGTDVFISPFMKEYIKYWNINFPNEATETSDITRIGVFVGHELFVSNISVILQVGYYVHYPFSYVSPYYERLGLKRYFGEKWFATASLKAHAADAETVEFGFGIRL